ncbi:hypothetical protein D3C72_570840 [compost metagenome]
MKFFGLTTNSFSTFDILKPEEKPFPKSAHEVKTGIVLSTGFEEFKCSKVLNM